MAAIIVVVGSISLAIPTFALMRILYQKKHNGNTKKAK
jgi:hypothetical protein